MIGRYTCVAVHVETAANRPAKTIRLRELEFWTTYFDVATYYRRQVARSIIDSTDFEDEEWRKAIIRDWFPPIESRSFSINNWVRVNSAAIEEQRGYPGSTPDDGYVRIRARAETILQSRIADLNKLKMAA